MFKTSFHGTPLAPLKLIWTYRHAPRIGWNNHDYCELSDGIIGWNYRMELMELRYAMRILKTPFLGRIGMRRDAICRRDAASQT